MVVVEEWSWTFIRVYGPPYTFIYGLIHPSVRLS
ncbi:uncharacterized protein J3R85_004492 [Psidium guajava]|nr:uncharacterized protein J3R85_004492 [Psidium guajava]